MISYHKIFQILLCTQICLKILERYISSESASMEASVMVGTRKNIIQSDILHLVEALEKKFCNTLN